MAMAKKPRTLNKTTKMKRKTTQKKLTNMNSKKFILFAFAALFGLVGVYVLLQGQAQSPFLEKGGKPFEDHPERGLYWGGLKSGKDLCAKLYEIVDNNGISQGCTHGPDPAPEGIDATKSVEPLSTGEDGIEAVAEAIPCEGDGVTGYRVQMIYARASDKADRYDQFAVSFQTYASNMNDMFVQSGLQTGSARSLRFVTDVSCNVTVARATLSVTGDDSIGNTASELRSQGFNRTDRKYVVWTDATVYCGIGYISGDTKHTQDNANNLGPTFGRVDSGCWGAGTAVHELVHNLGGAQLNAPHTSGGWHCTDEYDRLCYNDGGDIMTYVCPSDQESRLDCNKDDYFNTNPPAGSYLANYWNVANSRFLIAGNPVIPPPTPVGDTTAPTVTITNPQNGITVGNRTTISASSKDNIAVVKMEIYIDNALKATSTTGSISSNWNSRKASRGSHTITVKAYDAAGNVGTSTITVFK